MARTARTTAQKNALIDAKKQQTQPTIIPSHPYNTRSSSGTSSTPEQTIMVERPLTPEEIMAKKRLLLEMNKP